MDALLDHLEEAVEQTRAHVTGALGEGRVLTASDEQITRALALAAELQRLTEAVLVEATGEVSRRSQSAARDDRLTSRMGCHDVSELVQRLARCSASTAARLQRAAKPTMARVSFAGTAMPGMLPALHDAMIDGVIGLDGVLAVASPLAEMSRRVPYEKVLTADQVIAAIARGEGPDGAPPASADLLKIHATTWATYLDQDGAEPREERALRVRGITLGRERDGVVPISGNLMVEVAKQFELICHAIGSPRVDQDGPVMFRPSADVEPDPLDYRSDVRTPTQKRHDALATALSVAASSRLLPTIGGAAPTLVVSVREEDLIEGRGWAHIDGQPVSLAASVHAGCAGVIQRILTGGNGRIVKLGTEERVFNRRQRRAIALRDGGCVIPGCGVPAAWCEIHHVVDWALGGSTHTENGVLLCWYHHRHLANHGWQIRMSNGVPEVKAPPWAEREPRWRPATTSPTRLLERLNRRT
ncbi:HNH endonuclease signature motif containing protein [Microbacterium aoyamense]|uniref:HNH endonuclease signature motif containing protein n=1 Tax=Microbacterium aoyamense TaxID=344166 RepID=A0ABN2PPW7_9MICO|nr:HNH endonuclease signature motif containing protein [Microbacterium aoyamense]